MLVYLYFRSLNGYGPSYHPINIGFNQQMLPAATGYTYGMNIPYTGLEQSPYALPQNLSGVKELKELTVDDMMHSMIEALTNDNGMSTKEPDAFTRSNMFYSDAMNGKLFFGSQPGGFNYPDPNIFIHQVTMF